MTTNLRCPHCTAILAFIGGDGLEIVTRRALVSEAGVTPAAPASVDGQHAIASAVVGECEVCCNTYWFLECVVHPGSLSQLIEFLARDDATDHFGRLVERPGDHPPWILSEARSVAGWVQRHQIGPFRPTGPHFRAVDVSCCAGSVFWKDAADRAADNWPLIEAWSRNSRQTARPARDTHPTLLPSRDSAEELSRAAEDSIYDQVW